jgi:uncharacterized protein (TIGR02453 family)
MANLGKNALQFFRELERNNNRDWFTANKDRYESTVRDPALQLVGELGPVLRKISKHFDSDARPNGGSLARIYRDTRFSKDKTPYKTGLFMHFRHDRGNEEVSPGFYVHLGPGDSLVGGGVWQPSGPVLKKIRDSIVKSPATWTKATHGAGAGKLCSMRGDSLKRVPPGYPADHPLADELKRKDFGLGMDLDDKTVASDKLFDQLVAGLKHSAPFIELLCKVVGLPF